MAEIMREGGNEMKNNKKMIVGFLAPAVIIFLIDFFIPDRPDDYDEFLQN